MDSARSFLFVTWEGGGNVPPVLGVARRLAARGHAVRVLAEPCLADAVRQTGARFLPFTRHFVRVDRTEDLIGDWEPRTPVGALRRSMDNVIFGPAQIVAEETQRAASEERPDVLVADLMMTGSLVAAEAAAIPRVVLFHMPEYLPGPGRPAAGPGFLPREDLLGRLRDGLLKRLFFRLLAAYLPAFNDTRRAFGLAPYEKGEDLLEIFHTADLRIIQTCEAFDFPITPAPSNVRYVGPVLDDPDWVGTWESPWPEDDRRPLVVVSLSSTFQNQRGPLERIIEALGALDVRALVTLGPAMANESFDSPANVHVVAEAPHGLVFREAAAVVTHAGHGTLMRALAHGLPVVCIPMGRDQDDNAARTVACGAGLRLKRSAKPRRIRDAVKRVLDDPAFREAAGRLRREIERDVADDRAVRELEALARQSHPPASKPLESHAT
jgi:MGT family glycosyltransferase